MAIVFLQALEIAIEKVLEVLVEKHSGTFSPSFDEVERGTIEDAKQAFSSGLSEDQRAVATKRVAAVEDVFSGLPEQDAAVAIINDFNQSLGDRSKGKK